MDNNTYKRYAQGLLSVPEEKRIEEVEKLLYMLGHNWEDKRLLHAGKFKGRDIYIDGNEEDVSDLQEYFHNRSRV